MDEPPMPWTQTERISLPTWSNTPKGQSHAYPFNSQTFDAEIADRIIVLDQGKVAADGPKADVMRQLSGEPVKLMHRTLRRNVSRKRQRNRTIGGSRLHSRLQSRVLEERMPYANLLLLVVVGVVAAFVVWAYQSQVSQLIRGQGKVIPSGAHRLSRV